jgi:hypothetical protein
MEIVYKLKQHLLRKAFRLGMVAFLWIIVYACDKESIADFSFVNRLDQEVEVQFYFEENSYSGIVDSIYRIKSQQSVLLIRNQYKTSEEGFPPLGSSSYFIDFMDSVKVRYVGEETYIAVWRDFDDYEYASGYESLRNFYSDGGDAWSGVENRIQHGGSHVEYRYILELRDE